MVIFIIALVVALLIAYWRKQYLIGQMSNVEFAKGADVYLKNETFKLTKEDDHYLHTTVIRTSRNNDYDDD